MITMICVSLSLFAQIRSTPHVGRLNVEVADAADNAPIARGFVYVHNSYKSAQNQEDSVVKLDREGKGGVILTPGLYDVFVASGGFAPQCKVVQINSGQAVALSFRLEVDQEHMQQ